MTNYKIIKIPLKNKSENLDNLKTLIKSFNSKFKKSEIQLQLEKEEVKILLKEINFNKFENESNKFSKKDILFKKIYEKIKSIGSYGIKNGKRNYVDYNKEKKVVNRQKKAKQRGQFYYTKGHNFSKENNELPKNFENKIVCGDSEQILKQLPDNCIDLVFTSPPYNFGLEYENHQDDQYWEKYFEKLFSIFKEVIRVLKWGGRAIINVQPLYSDYIPSHHIISNFFINQKMIWKGEIIWEKNNYNCKYTAWGSWKSPSSPYLKYTWEFIEIFSKGDLKHSGSKDKIDITAEEFKEWVVAKWSIAPERDMKKYNHPAMFPEKLVERVLKLFSYQDDIILDPFNGAGTTTFVAKKLNRRFLGIDISEEYCKVANDRLKTIKTSLF
jgi:DNA modification methylase